MISRLRLFPLNTVLFPGATLNLHVFEPRYKQMIAECLTERQEFGVCLIREGNEAGDLQVAPHAIGTTAEIGDVTPLPFGRYYISTVGRRRFRIHGVVQREPYLLCDVEYIDDDAAPESSLDSLIEMVRGEFNEYVRLLMAYSGTAVAFDLPPDPVEASFAVGSALQIADALKQHLLETDDTEGRLRVELEFLRRLMPKLRSLLERKESAPRTLSTEPLGGESRTEQEHHFGKFFSLN
ncbi:MAG: LON peptidase substrate-binding domain-containing protein [Vulcanimicrobiaceae bacterium]